MRLRVESAGVRYFAWSSVVSTVLACLGIAQCTAQDCFALNCIAQANILNLARRSSSQLVFDVHADADPTIPPQRTKGVCPEC